MSSQDVGSQLGFFHTLKLAEITADVSDRLVSSIFVILEDHKILCLIVAQVTGMHVVHAVDVRVQRGNICTPAGFHYGCARTSDVALALPKS